MDVDTFVKKNFPEKAICLARSPPALKWALGIHRREIAMKLCVAELSGYFYVCREDGYIDCSAGEFPRGVVGYLLLRA